MPRPPVHRRPRDPLRRQVLGVVKKPAAGDPHDWQPVTHAGPPSKSQLTGAERCSACGWKRSTMTERTSCPGPTKEVA